MQYARQMFVCKVCRLLSQFRYLKDANLYTSRPHNSSSSTIHTAARFRHCCIQLSMKRWCQLNRARVAHNVRPALSSYQNKCSKPGHHITTVTSVTYGAWRCYSSVYTTIPRTGICEVDNDVGQSVIELGSPSSCRAYTAVYACYSVDQFFSLY